ncbi:MAG: hypothetical protein HC810_06020 [Acaryochloridaceae cyanobacterium RL_2_7]|nr:hypothetical protein [Acaryochloridaceae cyanobacterium RL_2_7]
MVQDIAVISDVQWAIEPIHMIADLAIPGDRTVYHAVDIPVGIYDPVFGAISVPHIPGP